MKYQIDETNKVKIINHFGDDFYRHVQDLMSTCISKWEVDDIGIVDSFSANLIFKGNSSKFGPIIIKFGRNHDEFKSEVQALKDFKGKDVCELYDVDYDNLVLVEEALEPGIVLNKEKNLTTRLNVFCDLFRQLHLGDGEVETVKSKDHPDFEYKSYKDWVYNITDYMEKKEDWHEVSIRMNEAKAYFDDLSKSYTAEKLLHGDFHYYNILKVENDYKLIDPKGVVGNWIFDLPRYILNEFWDEEDDLQVDTTIEKVVSFICKQLELTKEVLYKLLYIEGTMAMCWNIQDGTGLDEKEDILDTINWLGKYLN